MATESFWKRIGTKYRISVLNENTLNEIGHLHLSRLGVFCSIVGLFLFSFVLFASIIWFTPLKNYLPGYNENIRQELVTATERIDSLTHQVSVQSHYVKAIRDIVAGELSTDTIETLDSLTLISREKLLEEKSAIIEDFKEDYEQKEKSYLTLFDVVSSAPTYTLFRPAKGLIEKPFDDQKNLGIWIRTSEHEPITSVLAGTIIMANRTLDNEWVIMVQHAGDYLSIYKNAKQLLRKVGDVVQAGETLGIAHNQKPLYFELWQGGKPVNPEEVIAF